jgi:ribose/xylose/arabinose/galactoside ABC-type transport system permease subunit
MQLRVHKVFKRLLSSDFATPVLSLCAVLVLALFVAPEFFHIELRDGRLYGSIIDVLKRSAPIALLGLGMCLVIATGGIDLSVGAIMAISGAVCANLLVANNLPIPLVIACGIGVGLLLGVINGGLVSLLGIQPIVATLILMVAGRGVAQLINAGQIVTFQSSSFAALGTGHFLGLPNPTWILIFALLTLGLLLYRTALGLFVSSVGSNAKASRYVGIPVVGVLVGVYAISGVCAALAGIIATADIQGADANNVGLWLELDAILAVVLGGASLAGGRFSLLRTLIGVLIIQSLSTVIILSGVPAKYNLLIKAIVVISVLIAQSPQIKLMFARQFKANNGGAS